MNHVYSGFEPSQAFDIVHGGMLEHRLLSCAHASMEHQRLSLDGMRLETGCYDFPVIVQGSMPRDAICIGFMAAGAHVTRYNTLSISADEIQIYPPGAELLYHATGATRWINFTLSEARLQEVAMARAGRPLKIVRRTAHTVRLRPGGRSGLTDLADDALSIARRLSPTGGMTPELASAIGGTLTNSYVDALIEAAPPQKGLRASAQERHHHLILACERLALSGMEADITLNEVAHRSGYSLRALELIFRRSVGMTPRRWFMTARLNGALRDLLTCAPGTTVSDVAYKWGFRHFSRFSQYYAGAFGETPSDTLRRARD
ncbi:helix-turn-helix domain-containing protein [Achromobacter insolitus]|uniref:helix-turn-helix domain-containing protein n=1 Tax=Achromobacter insolitus TaxID=217204 RepID=UPI001CD29F94|nr:helix-turn-helix domain-containing protein [Achromobacter insolitus]